MENFFETREQASTAAADRMADALSRRLDSQPEASLIVSGGSTPRACLEELSSAPLDWQRTHVLLSDERWVPPDDPDSNEQMIRRTLLQNRAAHADFLSVYDSSTDAATRCETLDADIRAKPIPFSTALIGMGEDGHFASLFPDFDGLDAGLNVDSADLCLPVITAASPHPRITLTLAAISRSDEIVLLIFGDAKRAVYEQAKASPDAYPVSRLLLQKRAPVIVYWAP